MNNYIKNIGLYLKVVKEAAPYSFISLVLIIALMQALPFYISKIQSEIIDSIIEVVQTSSIITTGILSLILTYISVQLVSGLAGSVKGILLSSGNYKIQTLFEFKVLKKYLDLDIARYEDPDFRKLLQKGVDGGNQWSLHRLGMITYNLLFPALVKISISASIILFFDWKLFFIIIFAEVPPILNRIFFDRKEYSIWAKKETETQMRYFDLRGHIRNKSARTELKIYQIGTYILGKIKSMYDSTTGAVQGYEQKRLYINIFADFISAGAYGWAIYQTILHTLSGDITVGYMTFIFGAIFTAGRSVSDMLSAIADITEQNRYATHVREFFETDSILKTKNPTTIELKLDEAPEIHFENVTFEYPNQSKEIQGPILKNINLKLHPGEKIGLIGDNGAGKTTFIKLLLRIYDPSEGSIFINGTNLKNIPPEIWQSYISALMQDFVNYNFTIKEAIAISQQPNFLDEKKVHEAAKQSQAYTFIEKYEHGYDAQIGTDFGGVKFSGGQSQKMALARTFYRKAPIVILDEPTAAVDTESEIEIFKTLDTLGDKTTAIFISHDMATIGRASRIIVLDKGSVIEDGNHESLMKTQGGKYRRMYEEQVKAMVK